MYITKCATTIPVRKFQCHCCGTEFIANAAESMESGPAWSVDCPICRKECLAYYQDQLSEDEVREIMEKWSDAHDD